MKLNYQEHSLKSGIYKILNTVTGRSYIGQCSSFKKRWYQHSISLRNNKHQNKFLQADFNKCKEALGHDDFLEFQVLEVLDGSTKEERNLREEHWIAQTKGQDGTCYNFQVKVAGTSRLAYSQTPIETAAKKAKVMREVWQRPEFKQCQKEKLKDAWLNQGRREAFSKSAKTFWRSSEGKSARQIVVDARSKEFCVISPLGVVHHGKNMSSFCFEHGLSLKHFSALVLGRQKSHKGWRTFNKGVR